MRKQNLDFAHPPMEAIPAIEATLAGGSAVQIGTVHFLSGQRAPETGSAAHEEREISVILEGELEVISGGVRHVVGPGDLVDIPAGEAHYSTALSDSKVVYMLLS